MSQNHQKFWRGDLTESGIVACAAGKFEEAKCKANMEDMMEQLMDMPQWFYSGPVKEEPVSVPSTRKEKNLVRNAFYVGSILCPILVPK